MNLNGFGSLEERVKAVSKYIADNNATIRQASIRFNMSKSNIYLDATSRLQEIDAVLYDEVRFVLLRNKSIRHIRGGEATKQRWRLLKS